MNLYLVENDATVASLLTREDYRAGEDVVVCFSFLPYLRMRQAAGEHRFYLIEELFSPQDYRELHAAVDRFASQWYRSGDTDLTLHDGISFGQVTEIAFPREFMLPMLVKYGEALRLATIKHADAKTIFHDLSNEGNYYQYYLDDGGRFFNKTGVIERVGRQLNHAVQFLAPTRIAPPRWTSSIRRLFDPATLGWKNRLKLLLKVSIGKLLNLVVGITYPQSRHAVYFFSYFNLVELLHLAGPNVYLPSPTPSQIWSGTRYLDLMRVRGCASRGDRTFLEKLEGLCSGDRRPSEFEFTFRGLDYGEIFAPALNELCRHIIPDHLIYARRVENAIKGHYIKRMVVNDVLTDLAKTRLAVCRKLGVETVFVDHGIMMHKMAMKCASGCNPDLMIRPDQPDNKGAPHLYNLTAPSITLGNPCTDPYPAIKRRRIRRLKKMLLTTHSSNFLGRLDTVVFQEAYFRELLTALPALHALGVELHYRPHSENPEYTRYLFEFFEIDPSLVIISDWQIPFSKLIYEMDLYVGHGSTTFLESLAAGVPAIFFDPHHIPDAYFPPLNGKNGDEVIRIETGVELVELVQRNLNDATELASFMDHFHARHAHKYLNELDGKASARIAEVIFAT